MSSLRLFARAAIVASFGVLFAGGAHWGAARLTAAENGRRLEELNDLVLRHAETAIDSADRLLSAVAGGTPADCGSAALQIIRLQVYQHSGIKDVRVVSPDGAVRCSAYSETLEFDRAWPDRSEMLPVAGTALRLFRVEQFTSEALGVFKEVGPAALVAIVGLDPLQFDVIPGELRARGQVSLRLADGREVVRHAPAEWRPGNGAVSATQASSRFPIRTTIAVDRAALASWNAAPTLPLLAGAGGLGLLFGFLVARALDRPADAASALDRAIAGREFRPFYQPIFSLRTRSILGCEVLMRWRLPDGRILPPSAFIPLAESTGRIDPMTWQVLDAALDDLRPAMTARADFKVSVNIVPRQFLSAGFPARLRSVVEAAGASPAQIVLEITERDELEDLGRAEAVIRDLREHGFRVALDDVGVGRSGLSYIQRLRPDILKIDKFFVDSLGLHESADVVVAMLVRLAGVLGMTIVAEGVETDGQSAALLDCGVVEAQGYLFSRPVPAAAFLALLAPPAGEIPAALGKAA